MDFWQKPSGFTSVTWMSRKGCVGILTTLSWPCFAAPPRSPAYVDCINVAGAFSKFSPKSYLIVPPTLDHEEYKARVQSPQRTHVPGQLYVRATQVLTSEHQTDGLLPQYLKNVKSRIHCKDRPKSLIHSRLEGKMTSLWVTQREQH